MHEGARGLFFAEPVLCQHRLGLKRLVRKTRLGGSPGTRDWAVEKEGEGDLETLRSSLAVEVKGRQLLIPVSRGLPLPTWASSPTLWATAPALIPEAMLGVLPGEDLSSWLGTSRV